MSTVKNIFKKITTHKLREMKAIGEKISMLTAYDYSMAKILDRAGIDIVLVGDSASNVMAGNETTLPITLDHMIWHAQAVVKAVDRALVVVDVPFGSYQGNSSEALRSSIRIMKESGAHAVKMEGGIEIKESVERVINAGIPVMGHLGLTPQSIYKFGTYAVRAKESEEAKKLLNDALLLQELGCFSIVLEKIPALLGKQVAEHLHIPLIGIAYHEPPKLDHLRVSLHLCQSKEYASAQLLVYLITRVFFLIRWKNILAPVSYTHLTLPTTPYV